MSEATQSIEPTVVNRTEAAVLDVPALGPPGPRPRPRGRHPGIPPGDFAHDGIITSSTTGDAH